jgi:hypothetical protein
LRIDLSLESCSLVSTSSKLADRLLAHARLCRQIARQSWNEHTAAELERLANECDRAAAQDMPMAPAKRPLH